MAYFYPVITPPPYVTTTLSETFPGHHFPLQNTAHKIGHALHGLSPVTLNPHIDVRETMKQYYIDVELPGVSDRKDLKLFWTSAGTLLLEATTTRPPIPEEPEAESAKAHPDDAAQVHHTVRERGIGLHARSFNFAVPVERDQMKATLEAGLLRIVVPKHPTAQKEAKHVDVDIKAQNVTVQ
jgi:HSP20 family molecular chaperone IbpA